MSEAGISLGKSGEEHAVRYLKRAGYRVICRNYKSALGEIDIVAKDKDTLCFVEVKTRSSNVFGLPQEAVSRQKQGQISKAALNYLKENKLFDRRARFDVVAVTLKDEQPQVELIKNAFELDGHYSY